MGMEEIFENGIEINIKGRRVKINAETKYRSEREGELILYMEFMPLESDAPFVDSEGKFKLPIELIATKKEWIKGKIKEMVEEFIGTDIPVTYDVEDGDSSVLIRMEIGGDLEVIKCEGRIEREHISTRVSIPLTIAREDSDEMIENVFNFLRPIIVFVVEQIPAFLQEIRILKEKEESFLQKLVNKLQTEE
jgi:hypothetical protein